MSGDNTKDKIYYKPKYAQFIVALCGCALVFLGQVIAIIAGLFLVGSALIVQFAVKDYLVFELTDHSIIIYDPKGKEEVIGEIEYTDIEEWNVNRRKAYSLYLRLSNGRELLRETYQVGKLERRLKKRLPGKETMEIQAKKNRETKLVFRNPFNKKNKGKTEKTDTKKLYFDLVKGQIEDTYKTQHSKIKEIANIICDHMVKGGVIQLFGTKHGSEFVNELNYRAGGFAPYHAMNVDILDLHGEIQHDKIADGSVYEDLSVIPTLLAHYKLDDRDMIILVSQYGNEPVIVELAKMYKDKGQTVIAVVNKASYDAAESRHEGGKLLDYADAWLDMGSPEPDIAMTVKGLKVGQTSSTIANVIAQMLTAELYACYEERGLEAPVLLSANIDGADAHNNSLTNVYGGRVR